MWDEYVSADAATADYGVVVSGSLEAMDLAVDMEATEARRAEMRTARAAAEISP